MKAIKNWLPLVIIIIIFVCIYYFRLYQYLSFNSLKHHRQFLLHWTSEHYLLAVLCYISIYALVVAVSIPGAIFLTLLGGFLFGTIQGTIYVVLSATIGAGLIFFVMKTALREWVTKKTNVWIKKMEKGFQENAFSYLLFLRLVPLFPFWVVNIVPALLGVPFSTFIISTFIGIIPGSLIYVVVGNGLGSVLDTQQTANLHLLFEPRIFIPLLILGLLALLPIFYKHLKGMENDK